MNLNSKRFRVLLILIMVTVALVCEGGMLYYNISPWSPLRARNLGLSLDFNGNGNLYVSHLKKGMWGDKVGLRKGDIVESISIDKGAVYTVSSLSQLYRVMKVIPFDGSWSFNIIRQEKDKSVQKITLQALPVTVDNKLIFSRFKVFAPLLIFSLICFLTAALIGLMRPDNTSAIIASFLFICLGGAQWGQTGGMFPMFMREFILLLYSFLFSYFTAVFMCFFLVFPSPSFIDRKFPWLKRAGFWFAGIFSIWNFGYHQLQFRNPVLFREFLERLRWLDLVQDVIFVALLFIGILSLAGNAIQIKTRDERRRMVLLLIGSLGFIPWLSIYLLYILDTSREFPGWLIWLRGAAFLLFPAAFAYAVVKHRMFGIKVMLKRGVQFALLSRGVLFLETVGIFLVLYYSLRPLLFGIVEEHRQDFLAMSTAVITAGSVFALRKVNRFLMPTIERKFFREDYDARHILAKLATSARKLSGNPERLFRKVTHAIDSTIHPESLAVFMRISEIVRLPIGSEGLEKIKDIARKLSPDDFLCIWRMSQSSENNLESTLVSDSITILKGDSETAKILASSVEEDNPSAMRTDKAMEEPLALSVRAAETQEDSGTPATCPDSELLVPLMTNRRLLGFLSLGEKLSEEPYSREDGELLMTALQQVAYALDHASLVRHIQNQAQLRHEMEIARNVQESLLPKTFPSVRGIKYTGICKPAQYVGGDYFDFIACQEDRLGIALGDISGKGAPAALLMANLQAMLRIQTESKDCSPDKLLTALNARMCINTDQSHFATLFYALFDANDQTLTYANAGHNPPILLRKSPSGYNLIRLDATGTVLGVFPDAKYLSKTVYLMPGDLLIIFSDGITEAMNQNSEEFGEDRLIRVSLNDRDRSPEDIKDGILNNVESFIAGAPQSDDITLIVMQIEGEENLLTGLQETDHASTVAIQ